MYIKQQSKKRKRTNKKLGPKEKKEAINQTSSEEKVIVEAFQPKKKDNWKTKSWKKIQDFKPSQAWQVDLPHQLNGPATELPQQLNGPVAGPSCHAWQVDLPRVAGPTCQVWQVDLPQFFFYFFFPFIIIFVCGRSHLPRVAGWPATSFFLFFSFFYIYFFGFWSWN